MLEPVGPQPPIRLTLFSRFPVAIDRPWVGIIGALTFSGLAYLVRVAVEGVLPPGFPYVTFFPAVVLTAFIFGIRAGILSAVICGLLSWYFFISPFRQFAWDAGTAVALGLYTFVVAVDILLIHWTQVAYGALAEEREYSARLADNREVLFRELQHRVGNNLQMVAAMLGLQQRRLTGDAAIAISEASRRVTLIGSVQRKLYDPDGAQISLADFLGNIAGDVTALHGREDVKLDVAVEPGLSLRPEMAIPVAVVASEAIANAIEHGFVGRGGAVRLSARRAGDALAIECANNGAPLAPGFSLNGSSSLGMRIAATLAQQIGATLTVDQRGDWVTTGLTVPDKR